MSRCQWWFMQRITLNRDLLLQRGSTSQPKILPPSEPPRSRLLLQLMFVDSKPHDATSINVDRRLVRSQDMLLLSWSPIQVGLCPFNSSKFRPVCPQRFRPRKQQKCYVSFSRSQARCLGPSHIDPMRREPQWQRGIEF